MSETFVEIRRYSGVVETHRHDYHQVILPYSGNLEIEINHCAGRVTENIASFVPAGYDHSFLAQPENAFIVLDVAPERASKDLARAATPPFFAIGPDIRGLIDYLRVIIRDPCLRSLSSTHGLYLSWTVSTNIIAGLMGPRTLSIEPWHSCNTSWPIQSEIAILLKPSA
jgi:hypothetical protein